MSIPESIVAVGMFDGLHLGHQHLLRMLVDEAQRRSLRSVVVTFSHHPSCVLGRRAEEQWLDELDDRIAGINACGVDEVVVMDFTPELASLSACTFVRQVLLPDYGMKVLLLGYDSRFGNRSADDFSRLPQLGIAEGFSILHDTPWNFGGMPLSSTRIRQALAQGDVAEAAQMLGRNYSVGGTVVKGRQIGRLLGFPTANIDIAHCSKILPSDGVYSVLFHGNDHTWKGMANLGTQPTFNGAVRALEAHLLDCDSDLYGVNAKVEFVKYLRGIIRFDSREALIEQLNKDLKMI